jgi:uncharacterized membrane protein
MRHKHIILNTQLFEERVASAIGGGALALYGLSRRSIGGVALALIGSSLVYRSASGHCEF